MEGKKKMHHKCTACGKIYEESIDIVNGCDCGHKLFYFVKDKSKKTNKELNYFYELDDEDSDEIIVFDLESINILEHGKYEIDINSLMKSKEDCLVYKYGEGKYSIDIARHLSKIKNREK